jgi:NSS family neurotransmitter:Na+ symporter
MIDNKDRTSSTQWGSKLGFIAAAAGSAVGLGNIWRFPFVTGQNGGGLFVLCYLLCVVALGFPIMVAEVTIGRTTQSSPVRAFGQLSNHSRLWQAVGLLGVITGAVILSYYSVVAGWGLHYLMLSLLGWFPQANTPEVYTNLFDSLHQSVGVNIWWHSIFMIITTWVVLRGVRGGLEQVANIGMVTLFVIIIVLTIYATTLPGFGSALEFVFGHAERFTWISALEALGQAFFSLSLGMGAMLTYGSYLKRHDDTVSTSLAISLADTIVAVAACLILFPITFSVGLEPSAGPGLVFINIPLALHQLPLGGVAMFVFFLLLFIAALTSAISLLEVTTAFLIDSLGWRRLKAAITCGMVVYFLGLPSAASGGNGFFGSGMEQMIGMTWFDAFDYLASNWLLPLGGIGISLFVGWHINSQRRLSEFSEGSWLGSLAWVYSVWVFLIRWFAPAAIAFVMLNVLGIFS